MKVFKKFFTYPVFLILFLSIVGSILFGSLLRHHYLGGERFKSLQKIAVLIAETPKNARDMIKYRTINLNKLTYLSKHKDKKRFEQFIENNRNALIIIPRYVHSLSRSVVDVIDLNNFEIIHTYKHDIDEMYNQITENEKFPKLKADTSPDRFIYFHPLLNKDGSLITMDSYYPLFKIDFCSKLQWINQEEFHHAQEFDHEGNIWIGGTMSPQSPYVKKYSIKDFKDDAIVKINTDGKIIYKKSVTELLIENNILYNNFAYTSSNSKELDPIHLNDIQPALSSTEYWNKGDLFISIRNQNSIIHYRPSTNKVINYIIGPFAQQHDVDIISDKEISIFNNNNFFVDNKYSEVLIYNFETKKFRKLFNEQLKKENFKTISQGLNHIFKDGSLMVEEQNHGRIILFNNQGEKEWEYVNKDKNGNIGFVSWSRIIEDELLIEKFKLVVKNKKC